MRSKDWLLVGLTLAAALSGCSGGETPPIAPVEAAPPAVSTVPSSGTANTNLTPPALVAGDARLLTQPGVGEVRDGRLVSSGAAGFLAYGPYAALPAGNYRVMLQGAVHEVPAGAAVRIDVVSAAGAKVHAKTEVKVAQPDGTLGSLEFTLAQDVTDLEVRVEVPQSARVELAAYRIERR